MSHKINTSNFQLDMDDIAFSIVNVSSSKLQPKFTRVFRIIAKEHGKEVSLINFD